MMYISRRHLLKLAASKAKDLEALRAIFEEKYPGDYRARGLAVQYYNKFVIGDLSVTLTKDNLPKELPDTINELLDLLSKTDKNKKEDLKDKYFGLNFENLNEDYISWLHERYIMDKKNSEEIIHPIEEALDTFKKFPSIQAKYKNIPEFNEKVKESGFKDISIIKDLTLDDMENIISLSDSDLTVRVEGVEVKSGEFLGKFGEWNLWLPSTKETSVKIAGYDEKTYEPKTTWCTARTRGSNLFYNYIGRKDIPSFLFYIIKDNPEDAFDWLSLGYISNGDKLIPDFRKIDGGLSVNRDNKGLSEEDYGRILGNQWNNIRKKIESELEKHKVTEEGISRYVSPGRAFVERLAKNLEEFKKELRPKSTREKEDFIDVILNSDPSEEVKGAIAKEKARINPSEFLKNYSEKPWAKPYINWAAKKVAEKDPLDFLKKFSEQPWAQPYINGAAKKVAEKDPLDFLKKFSEQPWAQPYISTIAKKEIEKDPFDFLKKYSEKPWAEPYLNEVAKKVAEERPFVFLEYFPKKPWAYPHISTAADKVIKEEPYRFLVDFSEKPWSQPYINEVAKKVVEEIPFDFLYEFSKRPWAQPYINEAAEKAAEKNPFKFLVLFSEEPWAQHYIDGTAKKLAEKIPFDFLYEFSKRPWAQPYINEAAKKAAEVSPFDFLNNFSEKPWAQPYINKAAKKAAEERPFIFLRYLLEKPWAQPYINVAAKKVAEKETFDFLENFSEKPWANIKVIEIEGKLMTWLEYAKGLKSGDIKVASLAYSNKNVNLKIIKLATLINNLGLVEYSKKIKEL